MLRLRPSAKLAHMIVFTARKFSRTVSLFFLLCAPLFLPAQAPPRLRSIDIHPDHTVTFSYKDASATKVSLALDGVAKPIPMEKGATGVWTVTHPTTGS